MIDKIKEGLVCVAGYRYDWSWIRWEPFSGPVTLSAYKFRRPKHFSPFLYLWESEQLL